MEMMKLQLDYKQERNRKCERVNKDINPLINAINAMAFT